MGESLRAPLFSSPVNGRAEVCDSCVVFCCRVGYPVSHHRTEMSATELINCGGSLLLLLRTTAVRKEKEITTVFLICRLIFYFY